MRPSSPSRWPGRHDSAGSEQGRTRHHDATHQT
jgi:hypothetical protein